MVINTQIIRYTTSRPVVITALKVALLVGTLLALINHGASLIALHLTGTQWLQVGLTYLVPYGVSTYSSVNVLLATTENGRVGTPSP